MPEGHTLHRLARDHHQVFAGRRVGLSSPQGRFSDGARVLDQCEFLRAEAVGKHLLYAFPEGWIHIHLGLFGKFRLWRKDVEPRDSVRLRVSIPGAYLDLTGPTDCAVWSDEQVAALRCRLGPDPLDPAADVERFRANLRRRKRAIGAVLLDQAVVAGVGNVYRAELLFLSRLDPLVPAKELTDEQIDRLWADMLRLFPIGVTTNRIITTDPADFDKSPSKMSRAESLWVYMGSRCRVCEGEIVKGAVGSRTLYWCPSCQGA